MSLGSRIVTILQWSFVRNHLILTSGRIVTAQSHLQEMALFWQRKQTPAPLLWGFPVGSTWRQLGWAHPHMLFPSFAPGSVEPHPEPGREEKNGALATPAWELLPAFTHWLPAPHHSDLNVEGITSPCIILSYSLIALHSIQAVPLIHLSGHPAPYSISRL